jgi:hypothetical protein
VGDLAEVADCGAYVLFGVGEVRVVVVPAGEADRESECDQALLRAVVEVSLQCSALALGGGDDSLARRAQLLETVAVNGLQPFVLDRQPGGPRQLGCEVGVVEQAPLMHHREHVFFMRADEGDRLSV